MNGIRAAAQLAAITGTRREKTILGTEEEGNHRVLMHCYGPKVGL